MKASVVVNIKKAKAWSCFLFIKNGFVCLFLKKLVAQSSSHSSDSTSTADSTSSLDSTKSEQESEQEDQDLIKRKRRLPYLNGHTFIASATMPQTPFITTFF
jgi:hypothetical protein